MGFKVLFSQEALLELEKLDNVAAKQITNKVQEAAANPRHFAHRLSGRGESKLRAGDYRLLVRIDAKAELIFVVSLGHRKGIYKRLKR